MNRRLIDARQAAGLTQEQLAARAGMTARALGRIERGETRPHKSTQATLAMALGERRTWLFAGQQTEEEAA